MLSTLCVPADAPSTSGRSPVATRVAVVGPVHHGRRKEWAPGAPLRRQDLCTARAASAASEDAANAVARRVRKFFRSGLDVTPEMKVSAVSDTPRWIPEWVLQLLPALRYWDVWKAAAVTATCVAVYALLHGVPIPGMDHQLRQYAVGNTGGLAAGPWKDSFGLLRLGLQPYIQASITLSVFTSTLMPPSIRNLPPWENTSRYKKHGKAFEDGYRFELMAWTVALAAVNALGMAREASAFAVSPGLPFLALTSALLFCGTLLSIKISNFINSRGIGEGVSMLICVSILSDATRTVRTLIQTASVGLAPVGEVAWITALWAALGVFVAWMTRLEGRVPLRFFRISGPQSNWWRASPGPTSKPQGPSFPILLVNNAVMLLIFSQVSVHGMCSLLGMLPWMKTAVQGFLSSSMAVHQATVGCILLMSTLGSYASGLSADQALEKGQTGVDVTVTARFSKAVRALAKVEARVLASQAKELSRREIRSPEDATEKREVSLKLAAHQAEEAMQEEARAQGLGDVMVGRKIPPGKYQRYYMIWRSVTLGTLRAILLSALYMAAALLDAYARSTLGVELDSVSLLIITSLVMTVTRQVGSMLAMARARDAGAIALAPLRTAGPVYTLT